MFDINYKADIFLMAERKIIILLKGKIIEIEDNDDGIISQFLKKSYVRPLSFDKLILDLSLGNDDLEAFNEAVNQLKELEVIASTQKNFEKDGFFLTPFIPHEVKTNVWVARRGEIFYFFNSANYKKAVRKAKKFSLSWTYEVENGLVSAVFSSSVICLPAKINLPSFHINQLSDKEILEFSSDKKEALIYPNTSSGDFWKSLVDRANWSCGLVPIIKEVLSENKEPFNLSVPTFLACHKLHSLSDTNYDWQVGRDKDPKVAKGKAIMESIERFCGRKKLVEGRITVASYQELEEENCLNPLRFSNYSKYQYEKGWLKGVKKFELDDRIRWAKVKKWKSNEEFFIPECFITYSYKIYSPRHPRIFYTNSNGMSAHVDLHQAIKSSVLEIIERDALMIHWFNKISPSKIIFLENEPMSVRKFKNNLLKEGFYLEILDLTLDSAPVIMAVAIRTDNPSLSFFCGASSAENRLEAINKAIEELEFLFWDRMQNPAQLRKKAKSLNINSILRPEHHEMLYLKESMVKHIHFLVGGEDSEYDDALLSSKKDPFQALEAINADIYYTDITVKEVKELNLGILVVKVIIPNFIPITFGYGYEPLAMKRLYSVPLKLGLKNERITEKEMVDSYMPHFFA